MSMAKKAKRTRPLTRQDALSKWIVKNPPTKDCKSHPGFDLFFVDSSDLEMLVARAFRAGWDAAKRAEKGKVRRGK